MRALLARQIDAKARPRPSSAENRPAIDPSEPILAVSPNFDRATDRRQPNHSTPNSDPQVRQTVRVWVWVCDPWFSTEVGQAAWLALGTSMSGILRAWRVAAGKPGDWETELDRSSGEASKRVGGEPLSLRAWRRLLHAVGRERRRCPPPSGHPSAIPLTARPPPSGGITARRGNAAQVRRVVGKGGRRYVQQALGRFPRRRRNSYKYAVAAVEMTAGCTPYS